MSYSPGSISDTPSSEIIKNVMPLNTDEELSVSLQKLSEATRVIIDIVEQTKERFGDEVYVWASEINEMTNDVLSIAKEIKEKHLKRRITPVLVTPFNLDENSKSIMS
jgi:hypothetical protein